MSSIISSKLQQLIQTPSDINEHLDYLYKLSTSCNSVLECGVRTIVSTWAFMNGLLDNKNTVKKLACCDLIKSPSINEVESLCKENNINFTFFEESDLTIPMTDYDMIFIDTWHVYGHLKRELEKMHSYAKKYIVMHDTEVDKIYGESIRCGFNIQQQILDSGYPEEEIRSGLENAIVEFLASHSEWRIKERFIHNNGLTVLERI
jgi:hypothetical protein